MTPGNLTVTKASRRWDLPCKFTPPAPRLHGCRADAIAEVAIPLRLVPDVVSRVPELPVQTSRRARLRDSRVDEITGPISPRTVPTCAEADFGVPVDVGMVG